MQYGEDEEPKEPRDMDAFEEQDQDDDGDNAGDFAGIDADGGDGLERLLAQAGT